MRAWRFLLGSSIAIQAYAGAVADERASEGLQRESSARLVQSRAPTIVPPATGVEAGAAQRGSVGSANRGNESNLVAPFPSSAAAAGISDIDLSRQLAPNPAPRSLSQFASANRSSTAFRPTNIFGDFFGGQSSGSSLLIPITYLDVQGTFASNNNNIAFFLGTSTVPDLFSTGLANANDQFALAEPMNPTNAFVPANDGIQGFQFGKGTATRKATNNTNVSEASNNRFDITYFYSGNFSTPNNVSALYGRQKIAENVSPIPQNRLFLNYSYFDNTPLAGGLDVKRWSPGFESLIWNEETSLEVRLPMATTLNSNMFSDGTDRTHHEIGNLYFAIKHLLYRDDQSAFSIGLSATVPTADDIQIFVRSQTFGSRPILKIENESVHLLPFVGWYRGRDRLFAQGFCQLDIDTNGNRVSFNPNILQNQLASLGKLQDANFFYFDIQTGYWLRRRALDDQVRGCTGIAAVSELHWNRSLNAEDRLTYPNGIDLGRPRSDVQILNALLGMNFEYNYRTNLSVGYATPIGNGPDHEFKGEGRFLFNRFF